MSQGGQVKRSLPVWRGHQGHENCCQRPGHFSTCNVSDPGSGTFGDVSLLFLTKCFTFHTADDPRTFPYQFGDPCTTGANMAKYWHCPVVGRFCAPKSEIIQDHCKMRPAVDLQDLMLWCAESRDCRKMLLRLRFRARLFVCPEPPSSSEK